MTHPAAPRLPTPTHHLPPPPAQGDAKTLSSALKNAATTFGDPLQAAALLKDSQAQLEQYVGMATCWPQDATELTAAIEVRTHAASARARSLVGWLVAEWSVGPLDWGRRLSWRGSGQAGSTVLDSARRACPDRLPD